MTRSRVHSSPRSRQRIRRTLRRSPAASWLEQTREQGVGSWYRPHLTRSSCIPHDRERVERVAQQMRIPDASRSNVGEEPLAGVLTAPRRGQASGEIIRRADDQLAGTCVARRPSKPLEPRHDLGLKSSKAAAAPILAAARGVVAVKGVTRIAMQENRKVSAGSPDTQRVGRATLSNQSVLRRNLDGDVAQSVPFPTRGVYRDRVAGAGDPRFIARRDIHFRRAGLAAAASSKTSQGSHTAERPPPSGRYR